MKEIHFRILIICSITFYLIYCLLAFVWPFELTEDIETLRSWTGYDAYISQETFLVLAWIYSVLYIVGHVGIYFYMNWARMLLTILLIIGVVLSPFTGIEVFLPLESLVSSLIGITFTSIVILSFFSDMQNKFKSST
jgi:hypothetical protein